MLARRPSPRAFLAALACAAILVLCALVALPGTVYAAGTGKIEGSVTAGGFYPNFYLYDSSGAQVTYQGTSGASKVTFEGLDAGTYTIKVQDGFIFHEGGDPGSETVTVTSGQTTYTDLKVYAGITVSGTVKNASGTGLSGVDVWLYKDTTASMQTTTDANGAYTFYLKQDTSSTLYSLGRKAIGTTVGGVTYEDTYIATMSTSLTSNISGLDITMQQAAVTAYSLAIGSTRVTIANANDVLGDGGSVVYDASTHTLTLTNAKLDTAFNSYLNTVITTESDLQIALCGTNIITVPTASASRVGYSAGIFALNSSVTITSKDGGTLAITNPNSNSASFNTFPSGIVVRDGNLSLYWGVELNISADVGIMLDGSSSSVGNVSLDSLSVVTIDADLAGILATGEVSLSLSSILNASGGEYGMVASKLSVEDSNMTISGSSQALTDSYGSPIPFDAYDVDVVADTNVSGANANTYVDADQTSYRFIQTTAKYTETVQIPLSLIVTSESGEAIPVTDFSFLVEAFADTATNPLTAAQMKRLNTMLTNFMKIDTSNNKVHVTGTGTLTDNYLTLSLTSGAAMTLGQFGLKVSLASVPAGWKSGGEQYKIAFTHNASGNLVIEGFYAISSGVAATTASSSATFTVTRTAQLLPATGDTMDVWLWGGIALLAAALVGAGVIVRRKKKEQ